MEVLPVVGVLGRDQLCQKTGRFVAAQYESELSGRDLTHELMIGYEKSMKSVNALKTLIFEWLEKPFAAAKEMTYSTRSKNNLQPPKKLY